METLNASTNAPGLASTVAPEDLNCGDYVAVLNVICEYPSFFWGCDSGAVQPDEPVRIQFQNPSDGTPMKVKAICLPFVFVKTPNGKSATYDVRRTQFVRLSSHYANQVWKEMK